MSRLCLKAFALLVVAGINQQVVAEDIFFTVAERTASLNNIVNGNFPSDTGSEAITIRSQTTATLMLWSDGELVIDPSTGPAFGYSISMTTSNQAVISGIAGVTSINPRGSDNERRWFDTFDFDTTWTAIGAATFDSGQGLSPGRKAMDPFYDADRNAFLLGYTTISAGGPGVSELMPTLIPFLSLTGNESVGGVNVTVTAIPEPNSLVVAGLISLGVVLRRKRK